MLSTPMLKVERVTQLDPGELFLFEFDNVQSVGFVCDYRNPDTQKLVLPLGPSFPSFAAGPRLVDIKMAAISFGTNFVIRLPVNPQDWSATEPGDGQRFLLVTSTAVYFKANGSEDPRRFQACFVNVATGVVEVMPGSFPPGQLAIPSGTAAFAKSWEIVTAEDQPRTILKYPFTPAPLALGV
jgi:hypothetical protein